MTTLNLLGLASFLFVAGFTWWAATRAPGVGQSPRGAIIEAWANIIVGFSVNMVANLALIPLMAPGGHMSLMTNFAGGWVFTAISIIRQFCIRRYANARLHALAQRMAGDKS